MIFQFKQKLQKYKKEFDPFLLTHIPKTPQTLWYPVIYQFKTGGKRWRPFLIRIVGQLYKVPLATSRLLEIIVELTHNWTLIHDDIEDGDSLRRGKLTVWKKFGLDYGINSGDAIFALSFKILKEGEKIWGKKTTLFLLERLSKTLIGLAEGQNSEFDFRKNPNNIRTSDYINMVKKKTALLPKFGILGIAEIANVSEKESQALETFCDSIFPAFQIKDDILNLIGKKEYGKEIGGDIREGKRTLPLIHLLNKVSFGKKNRILKIILKKREETTRREVKEIISLMRKEGSIEFAHSLTERLIRKGLGSLSLLPENSKKKTLEETSHWLAKKRVY